MPHFWSDFDEVMRVEGWRWCKVEYDTPCTSSTIQSYLTTPYLVSLSWSFIADELIIRYKGAWVDRASWLQTRLSTSSIVRSDCTNHYEKHCYWKTCSLDAPGEGPTSLRYLYYWQWSLHQPTDTYTVKFYEFLGLKNILKVPHSEENYDIYTLAYDFPESVSFEAHCTNRQGVLQLKHRHGSETDENFKVHNGNSDPGKGFGHVCISVDNIQAACQRIEDAGYRFKKKLSDGRMRNIAFALDPDDYWVRFQWQKMMLQPWLKLFRLK